MIGVNKSLRELNLMNNMMKDELPMEFLSELSNNQVIISINFYGNSVNFQHIKTMQTMLNGNKLLNKKNLVPEYRSQIKRLRLNPKRFIEMQKEMDKIDKQSHSEEIRVQKAEQILIETQNLQSNLTSQLMKEKKEVDQRLLELDQEILSADNEIRIKKTHDKYEVVGTENKIFKMSGVLGKITLESIINKNI